MIKRPTWILVVLLALSISAYFLLKHLSSSNSAELTPTPTSTQYLFSEDDGTLQGLQISDDNNQIVQLQHNSQGDWIITLPELSDADQALAEAAATQAAALRVISSLSAQLDLTNAGLITPSYTIELSFDNDLKHVIQIGALTPSNSGYYVRTDDGALYVISQSGIDALLKLLTSPPYPATATPTATMQETPTPIN
jgi:hypothetical protein